MFAGVVSRYGFNAPLTGSDELASILFLWLAMLGAVIALRRDEHLRLTTFIGMLRPRRRAWVEALGVVVRVCVGALEEQLTHRRGAEDAERRRGIQIDFFSAIPLRSLRLCGV